MKKTILAVLAIILLITPLAQADDTSEIKDAFRQYVEAAVHSDGAAAAEIFSDSAADYWSGMLKDARALSRNELEQRPAYQMFNIILIRKRIEDDPAIARMDGRQFLQHSYAKGWNSSRALNHLYENRDLFDLEPEIKNDSAELKIRHDGEMLPAAFYFIKERGRWKLDGKKQFGLVEKNIEAKTRLTKQSKAEFAEMLFKRIFNDAVPDRFWMPLN